MPNLNPLNKKGALFVFPFFAGIDGDEGLLRFSGSVIIDIQAMWST
ncbi:MAG: hypothetical protein V4613_00305 [Bacteroidota bacterium]